MTAVGADTAELTAEQLAAVQRREGDLFLDAGAGSGKTSVLVERFARSVVEDGLDPTAILTITFTDKAAAEMRERIRERLRELGALDAARATEGAFISTIHGFCARVLRAHALAAGIDPAFVVIDELESARLADSAFEAALVELAEQASGAVELIASYGVLDLRGATQAVYAQLRSRGQRHPRLPLLPVAPDLEAARGELLRAASIAADELGGLPAPSARVVQALESLERVPHRLTSPAPWPAELDSLRLPGGNGAALSATACVAYGDALTAFRAASAYHWAERVHPLLDRLLVAFGVRYEDRKRERSTLDFEDLELLCRDLLRDDEELRDRYRARFERVMVDELQDTNAVQLELIDSISKGALFTVGDAQQSIYGFRHADVELFERRGGELAALGARATLQTSFRARKAILDVINRVFAEELGDNFRALVAGRTDPPSDDPRVELLVVDRDGDWGSDGLAAPWRVAEARALAARVWELIAGGASPRDVVVLTRATTDIRVYERALEERGVPTYLIGGRGYWSHPQVVDLLCYLRLLANPRDEEALYMVLASPQVGASVDALVSLAAAARGSGRDPWWVLREPRTDLDELSAADRERIVPFVAWLAAERQVAARKGIEELIERALERTGYDLAVLAMPGGQRRLANVRKLMRLGREHVAVNGPDLRAFLELVRRRADSWSPDPDESEAPVESEALDAVRLMTIHRAKGLEFEVVCVADLGRGPRWSGEVVRLGRDGRFGLRLARPGTGRRENALAYDELGEERRERVAREERRLFYVAVTRAKERLILSGAAKMDSWGPPAAFGPPIGWLGPALVPDVSGGSGVSEGVRFRVVLPSVQDVDDFRVGIRTSDRPGPRLAPVEPPPPPPSPTPRPPVTSLSYTALAAYQRCGYRFYVERVLGVPGPEPTAADTERTRALTPVERGIAVHALLERLDFRRPVIPTPAAIAAAAPREPSAAEAEEIASLLKGFAATNMARRLGGATRVLREQRFSFPFAGILITGALDVIAAEPPARTLIVDYKTDRLVDRDGARLAPDKIVADEYATQQLVYAVAALRAGANEVEVVHVFLDEPGEPVAATFTRADADELERQLAELVGGVLRREFPVTETPHRGLCNGCPAEGGLCSWPLEVTRREQLDRLF
jgi:ATP-dependent exoDNAse (exonuclease V) beta subunit